MTYVLDYISIGYHHLYGPSVPWLRWLIEVLLAHVLSTFSWPINFNNRIMRKCKYLIPPIYAHQCGQQLWCVYIFDKYWRAIDLRVLTKNECEKTKEIDKSESRVKFNREREREKFLLTILNEALWTSREEKAGNAISNVDVHQMQS